MAHTHMIVATIITTVALTAGVIMPGGFDGNQEPKQGSIVLLRRTSFKTFMIADTIALLFSIYSLFLYFMTQFNFIEGVLFFLARCCNNFQHYFDCSMMMAFIAGTCAVLSNSSTLTIISGLYSYINK